MWERKIRSLLRQKLEKAQADNPKISMRDIATELNLSSGALSELLSGKRRLSAKAARKLLPLLDMSVPDRAAYLKWIEGEGRKHRTLLPADAYELMSRWVYFAVVSVLAMAEPPRTAAEVAATLNLSLEESTETLETLVDFDLVKRHAGGGYESINHVLSRVDASNEQSQAPSISAEHAENLKSAMAALNALRGSRSG